MYTKYFIILDILKCFEAKVNVRNILTKETKHRAHCALNGNRNRKSVPTASVSKHRNLF